LQHDFGRQAIEYSRRYGGKIELIGRVPVRSLNDFSTWYTPGVASVSLAIRDDPKLSFELTSRWNTIAVVTDGSRVLGLGNVGPEAAMPVMEGKSLIFKYLGGVNAVPLTLGTRDVDEIVRTVKVLEPSFGGINLEDIESPKCFEVLDRLKELRIPVWHDDQQGTAGAVLAALFNALELTGRDIRNSRMALVGCGAANIATAHLLTSAGADPGNLIMVDTRGVLHPERDDIDELMLNHPRKYELAIKTNRDRIVGGVEEAMAGADVVIGASTAGVIRKEWVRKMASDPIVFALANPIPEILPDAALEAGAKIVATGRSDFPNQVNNSLLFPGMFRGLLDCRAKGVTDGMVIAAARELADYVKDRISPSCIIPTMEEWDVYARVAAAVGETASREGVARVSRSRQEFYKIAKDIIDKSRRLSALLLQSGFIPDHMR